VQTQIAVVISNLDVPPRNPSQLREVSFILAKQLHHFHSKGQQISCFCSKQIFFVLVTKHVTTKTAQYHKHMVYYVYIVGNIQHQIQMRFTGKYLDPHMRFQYENVSYDNARPLSSGPNLHQRFIVCCVSIELVASDGS
jgi:hypothetical protein